MALLGGDGRGSMSKQGPPVLNARFLPMGLPGPRRRELSLFTGDFGEEVSGGGLFLGGRPGERPVPLLVCEPDMVSFLAPRPFLLLNNTAVLLFTPDGEEVMSFASE